MHDRVTKAFLQIVVWSERLLALVVLAGVAFWAVASGAVLAATDWHTTEWLYELIYRVLLLVIGLELVRMLVMHDLLAVLELLAFVIARKMLKPDLGSVDIALGVTAFVLLLGARHYLGDTASARDHRGGNGPADTDRD